MVALLPCERPARAAALRQRIRYWQPGPWMSSPVADDVACFRPGAKASTKDRSAKKSGPNGPWCYGRGPVFTYGGKCVGRYDAPCGGPPCVLRTSHASRFVILSDGPLRSARGLEFVLLLRFLGGEQANFDQVER